MKNFFALKVGALLLAPMLLFSGVLYEGSSSDVESIVAKAGLVSLAAGNKDAVFESKKNEAKAKVYVKDNTLNKKIWPQIPVRVNLSHKQYSLSLTIDPLILAKNKSVYISFMSDEGTILLDASSELSGRGSGEIVDIRF